MGCGHSTAAMKKAVQLKMEKDKKKNAPPNALTMGLGVAAGEYNLEKQDLETSIGLETEIDIEYSADYSHG